MISEPICPYGMCETDTVDHTICAKMFAARVNDFTKTLERKAHPKGRCIFCGGGEVYWKHKLEYVYRDGAHVFIGEYERIDPETQFQVWDGWMRKWIKDHPINTVQDNGERVWNWRAIGEVGSNDWAIEIGY